MKAAMSDVTECANGTLIDGAELQAMAMLQNAMEFPACAHLFGVALPHGPRRKGRTAPNGLAGCHPAIPSSAA